MRDLPIGQSKMGLAALAALGVVLIAVLGAIATYIDNYYTESVGQWVAQRPARAHLRSPAAPVARATTTTQQTGVLLSTITNDVDHGAGLRLVRDAGHPGRPADHRRHRRR